MFGENNMMELMSNMQFKKVENLYFGMDGKIGVQMKDGIYSYDVEKNDILVNPMPFMNFKMPAFAFPTTLEQIASGDMVVGSTGKVMGWIQSVADGVFKIKTVDGFSNEWKPPKVKVFGFESGNPMIVRSFLNLSGGKGFDQNMMVQMMMLQKMSGDEDNGMMDDVMPFMIMGMANGTSTDGAFSPSSIMQFTMMKKLMDKMDGKIKEPVVRLKPRHETSLDGGYWSK